MQFAENKSPHRARNVVNTTTARRQELG